MSETRGRSRKKQLLIGLILVLIPFVLVEILLRVMGIGQAIVYEEDTARGYRPIPSQRFSTMGFPIAILSSGVRGPVDKSDIMFVGDSVTYGTAAVRDEETFPALLGGVNAAVNGYGPQNVAAQLASVDLSPFKTVVWVMPSADVLRPFGVLKDGVVRAAGFVGPNKDMTLRLEYLFRFGWYRWFDKSQNAMPAEGEFDRNVESVVKTAALLQSKNVRLLLVFLPYREEVHGGKMLETPFVAKMKAQLKERGVPFVEVTPPGDVEQVKKLYRDTTHLTAEGNRWISGELRPLLQKPPS